MAIERRPEKPSLPPTAAVVVGVLTLFAIWVLVQWVIGTVLGLLRLAFFGAVVVGLAMLVLRSRD